MIDAMMDEIVSILGRLQCLPRHHSGLPQLPSLDQSQSTALLPSTQDCVIESHTFLRFITALQLKSSTPHQQPSTILLIVWSW